MHQRIVLGTKSWDTSETELRFLVKRGGVYSSGIESRLPPPSRTCIAYVCGPRVGVTSAQIRLMWMLTVWVTHDRWFIIIIITIISSRAAAAAAAAGVWVNKHVSSQSELLTDINCAELAVQWCILVTTDHVTRHHFTHAPNTSLDWLLIDWLIDWLVDESCSLLEYTRNTPIRSCRLSPCRRLFVVVFIATIVSISKTSL